MSSDTARKPVLILPCSASKVAGPQQAILKYTGSSVWKMLRSRPDWPRIQRDCEIVVVSAEYGVLFSDDVVLDYDRKLDAARVAVLSTSPQQSARAASAVTDRPAIYVALPRLYRELFERLAGSSLHGQMVFRFSPGAGIGKQRQQLSQWATDIAQSSR